MNNKETAGMRVPGYLARYPIIGWLMVVSGGLIFGILAYNVQIHGPLLNWDVPLADYLHRVALNSPLFVKNLMVAGFYIGKEVVVAIAIALICYYLYKRFWRELAMVAIGFGGGGVLWFVLSRYFDRHRPVFDNPIWKVLNEAGFPSGHTLTAVVCYGFLAYIISARVSSRFWHWATIAVAIGIVLFIGCSRLFLGDHYLTDILAGYALGLFWAGLVYTSVEVYFDKSSEPSANTRC
jgi:membrane-associated phospholipid phosphatase